MKITCFILFFLLTFSIYASGGMEKLTDEDKSEITLKFMEADEILLYTFWSSNVEDDYHNEKPDLTIKDLDKIKVIIESISFVDVPVAECGFDYTLILKKENKLLLDSPIRYNLKCNNVSFYWREEYFVSGIRDIKSLENIFVENAKE